MSLRSLAAALAIFGMPQPWSPTLRLPWLTAPPRHTTRSRRRSRACFLPGSRTEGCSGHSFAARLSVIVSDVRNSDPATRRSLSSRRPGLSRLRTERGPGASRFRLHLRPSGGRRGRAHDCARPKGLCSVHARLRRPGRLPPCACASRTRARADHSERRGARGVDWGSLREARRRYWANPTAEVDNLKANFTSLAATRQRHLGSSPHPERYDPDAWTDEYAFLSRPGQAEIQAALFYDYRTNVAAYPKWRAWLREKLPPPLVVWGKYDPSFTTAGAMAYQRDVPNAEIHLLDAGHFALDEACDEIAALMRAFLARNGIGGT